MEPHTSIFSVELPRKVAKSIRDLEKRHQSRILELLTVIEGDPVPARQYDLKKLQGYTDTYRVRIGDVRIIYEIDWEARVISVLKVAQREKAYG